MWAETGCVYLALVECDCVYIGTWEGDKTGPECMIPLLFVFVFAWVGHIVYISHGTNERNHASETFRNVMKLYFSRKSSPLNDHAIYRLASTRAAQLRACKV